MWKSIARFILRQRFFLLGLLTVATVYMGFVGKDIQLSYQYAPLLPATDSVYIENQKFIETFGKGDEVIIAGVECADFFEIDHFHLWQEMCDSIEKIDGVEATISVEALTNIVKNRESKRFDFTPLFPEKVKSKGQLDSICSIIDNLPFYKGKLYNSETNVYMLAITVDRATMATLAREDLVSKIESVCRDYQEKSGVFVHMSGLPYIRVITAQKIKKEFGMFIVLALLLVAGILFLFFRALKQVVLPMIVVMVGVVWVIGTMTLLGYKITLLTGMIPPLLIVIGIPNCIFLVNKYHSEYVKHGNKIMALQRIIMKIGNATLLTNITTASGFATFLITSSDILREFGLIASINILVVFFASLIIIPASFSLMAPPRLKDTHHLNSKFFSILISKLVMIVLRRRAVIYIISGVLVVAGVIGINKIESTGFMVDDIPEESAIKKDLKFFESNFDGVMPLEISVDTRKANRVLKSSVLVKLNDLSEEIANLDEVSEAISVVPLLKFAKQSYFNGNPKYYKLPSSREQAFILNYASNSLESNTDGGENALGNITAFVDSTKQKARLSFRVKDIGTDRMEALIDSITTISASYFPNDSYDVTITGSSVVFAKGTQYLVKSLFQSLGLAVILIALFMAMMFKKWRMVLISMIPNIVPLIFTAAVMGYAGIPIKASTILVFSIAFGISVDDTIHFLAKYRQELVITGGRIGESVVLALRETGISMIYTSIVLFFGFSIFGLSEFGGTVALGVLVALTLMIALFANLMLLPCILIDMQRGSKQSVTLPDLDDEGVPSYIGEDKVIDFGEDKGVDK